MFYIAAQADTSLRINDVENYTLVGFSTNIYAVLIYNDKGNPATNISDNYIVIEYDVETNEDMRLILENDWCYNTNNVRVDDLYIELYETIFGDMISLTNEEFDELILFDDRISEYLNQGLYILYEYLTRYEDMVRDNPIKRIVREIFARYLNIFKLLQYDASMLDQRVSNIQVYICMMKEDDHLHFY